ncbi:MAG: hypothetical protein KGI04_03710 [Candidatus Micrarchaeota archaeon]|nr:hypothetical protein [Candidatus Micrarchaeota archaeon]
MRDKKPRRLDVFKRIFTSPFYILVAIVAIVAYYALFSYLIISSNKGIFLVTAPIYLVYALILSAAVLLATSVYAVSVSIRARYAGAEGSALSIITSSFGGLIIGCNCYAPIFASMLYAIGFGSLQVSSAISFLGVYQVWLVALLVAANLIFIYYQLGRIMRIGSASRSR